MLDVPNIYNDPIISRKRKGDYLDPFIPIKESFTIDSHYVLLSEIPNRHDRVKVKVPNSDKEMHEVTGEDGDYILRENEFRVDYTEGIVYIHESLLNKTLDFEYTGEGVHLFPDSRVYHTKDRRFPNLRDKIDDIDRAILVERHRIDEQLLSHPQPSEVIDIRIDYHGKVYRVAKDRIDAEQRRVEEAFIDAHDNEYDSLKSRIDGLQLDLESDIYDINSWITELETQLQVVPGKITAAVNELRQEKNGDIAYLESKLQLVPDQISASVSELRETVDGEFISMSSALQILSDRIDLKVDVNGVISSINLSEEGIRLQGKRIHLDGESRIDNAVIKSAHIDNVSADKIRTGVLRSQNDNTRFNLNTGELVMQNASFTISNGGRINFVDPANKIQYMQVDPQTGDENYVGVGLGRNINLRFPFVYMGTTRNSQLRVTEDVDFTGFIANTDARIDADRAANSVIGDRFHIRDRAKGYVYGFRFDLSKNVKTFRGMNNHHDGIHYDIGESTRRFRNVYAYNMRHNGEIRLRDSREGRTGGWLVQTHYSGDGSGITLRGLNGGKYNYSIGAKQSYNRITRLYLKNKPNVSSDERLKEEINDLELGLDFTLSLSPVSFKFKETEADQIKNKNEFGFIAQEVKSSLKRFGVDLKKFSLVSQDDDGYLAMEHEQLIAPLTKSIQELYYLTRKENKDLKQEISSLKEQIQELKGVN